MAADYPDDGTEIGRITRNVSTHFIRPSTFILNDPFLKPASEESRIKTLGPSLLLEERTHFSKNDAQGVGQLKEVVQVPTLEPLNHAPQLLCCNFVKCVDIE